MKNYYSTVDNIVTTFSNIEEKRQVLILPSIFDFMEWDYFGSQDGGAYNQ